MWNVAKARDEQDIPLDKNRRTFFEKKYRDSVVRLDGRLQELVEGLNAGLSLKTVLSKGWVHPERSGVFAICLNDPPLRLYFLPLPPLEVLLTLTIGDKNRQSADVIQTAEWAKSIIGDLQRGTE